MVEIANQTIPITLPPEILDSVGFFLGIGKAIGIAVLVYIIFNIIQSIFQMGQTRSIKKMSKNVEEINNKLNELIKKKSKKE